MNRPIPHHAILVCAPNIGVLDNWLPVVSELRQRAPELRITLVYPAPDLYMQAGTNPVLASLADALCDRILVRLGPASWVSIDRHSSLMSALSKWRPAGFFSRLAVRLSNSSRLAPLGSRAASIAARFAARCEGVDRIDWPDGVGRPDSLLYDICETAKPYFGSLIEPFLEVSGFSVTHGFTVPSENQAGRGAPASISAGLRKHMDARLTAYAQSTKQSPLYQSRYQVGANSLVHAGISRHSEDWVGQLQGVYNDLPEAFSEQFVFVISRPCNRLLPVERKTRIITELRELCNERSGLRIVIKEHPKERREKIYERILGQSNYGKTWIYSQNHPLDLGQRCCFGLSFYSGIAVDLIWMGVPAIEYLDLRGINDYDHPGAPRDAHGNPVTEYRNWNLVRGVQTGEELREAVDELEADPKQFVRPHQDAYRALYGEVGAPAERIAEDMLGRMG